MAVGQRSGRAEWERLRPSRARPGNGAASSTFDRPRMDWMPGCAADRPHAEWGRGVRDGRELCRWGTDGHSKEQDDPNGLAFPQGSQPLGETSLFHAGEDLVELRLGHEESVMVRPISPSLSMKSTLTTFAVVTT
jgi:hypothetical protein